MIIKDHRKTLLHVFDEVIILRCGLSGNDHKVVYKSLRVKDFAANSYGIRFDIIDRVKRK